VGFLLLLSSLLAHAQRGAAATTLAPAQPSVPAGATAVAGFRADLATDAWLATVPARDKARSDAYFEGGYWLLFWDFLWNAAVLLLIVLSGFSAKMRGFATRLSRFRPLQDALYWIQYCVVSAIAMFPALCYEAFFRERQYGLMNQSFSSWMRDQAVAFVALIVPAGLLFLPLLMALVRRFPRSWHIWMTAAATLIGIFVTAIFPVYVVPLFNTSKPLEDLRLKDQILSLARANGIPATDVYEVNASRQSKRVSANVSGFAGTERITLNDNLLRRVSPAGVLSTMGHEMGHYVLHHIVNGILFGLIVSAAVLTTLRACLYWLLRRWGERWGIAGPRDVAVLPVALLVLSIWNLLFTPIGNTFTRTQEYEADLYGLNAARQPDGEAEVDLLLGEYRKLSPTRLEEFIFFDHPSGRTRIYAAMRWKQENLCLFNAALACSNPPEALTGAPSPPIQQNGR
jgi:STE24 endopeptidase